MTAPILVVDDEPAIRRLVRAALERSGSQVDSASPCATAPWATASAF